MFKKSVFFTTIYLMGFVLKAQTVVNSFNTMIEPNIPLGLTNPLFNQGSPMSYNPAEVATKGAAFQFDYTNQGGSSFDGYPSGKIGSLKIGGDYNVADSNLCGMPVQIKNLKHLLRFNWDTFQENANDPTDKWWATINVIFDAGLAIDEPDPLARDYDLVIQHVSYEQDDFQDLPNNGNGRYWYFARDAESNQIKPFTLYLNGQSYRWAVRYKFFNFPADHENFYQNDKVHIKFIPLNNNDTIPYFDHSLKSFVDATKDYLSHVNLTLQERQLANSKVANPELWIKGIAAGYEVYEGQSTLGNLFFFTTQDTTAPSPPQNLACSISGNTISLNWDDVLDADLEHYTVYKSINMGAFEKVADSLYSSQWQDVNASSYDHYRYYISSKDRSYNESDASTVCIQGCQKPDLVITHAEIQKYGSNQITLQVSVSNIGYATVNNLQNIALAVRASTDDTATNGDQLFPFVYPMSGSLTPGSHAIFNIDLPINWASDKHYMLLTIDENQQIDECRNDNNELALLVKGCTSAGPIVLEGTIAPGLYATKHAITIQPNTILSDDTLIIGTSIMGLPTNAFDKQNVTMMIGSCL